MRGAYPITNSVDGVKKTETLYNPFHYQENGVNKFSLTGGLQINLFVFHIFGQYTIAKYPSANAGISFSFR
jgi:hypothetical protein